MKASETQIAGQHYKDFPIQPAEFCQRNRLNWCEANVVKYTCRHAKKNGMEDLRKAMHYLELLAEFEYGEPLNPSEDVTPLNELYLHGTHCDTCARPDCAKGEYPATKDGGCEGYVKREPEGADNCHHYDPADKTCMGKPHMDCYRCEDYAPRLASAVFSAKDAPTAAERPAPHTDPATNCKDCGNTFCVGVGRDLTCDQGCERFEPKGEPVEWLDLTLPSITIPCTGSDILNKLAEEIEEYECAEQGSMAELIEAWDCIQVAQTFDEHGGGVRPHIISKISRNLADWHKEGRPVLRAKRAMIIKNAARAMYSIEDTADILATL